ncbi:D-amino-acid transaminase [Virgibacillus sp. W0181]|uniref:D-amino-acid transaminase n=1 Tax=Virgibacillus sp. W0181 TaxID=3391581 RepID=UPI003F46EB17
MSVYPIMMSQGKFVHSDSLKYPYEERGAQFGDGIYEVIRIYEGNYYLLNEHVDRLFRSLEAIKISIDYTKEEIIALLEQLIQKNSMENDGMVYLQITRGSAPRVHTFPENVTPNVYAYMDDFPRFLNEMENGVSVITHKDTRWDYCYIKSLNLLPNILAKQEALEQDCYEAILHKDGIITECCSSNIFLIKDGSIYTHPATEQILHGCVRLAVKRLAKQLNIPFVEEAFTLDDIATADELFLTSSMSEIMPVVQVDGRQVKDGSPGEITKKLQLAYEKDANIASRKVNS